MNIKIKTLESKGVVPSIEANGLNLTCMDILTEVGKDGRLVLIYRTGISVEIPDGYIGLITPVRTSPIYSMVDAAGPQIISSTYSGELVARYKVNTDSVPAIFEPGEIFARLIFIPVLENINTVVEESTTELENKESVSDNEEQAGGEVIEPEVTDESAKYTESESV